MFDVGGGELLLIVLAVLLLFGPKKLPEIAQMMSKGMKQVRKAQSQFQSQMSEIQNEIKDATDVDVSDLNLKNINKPGKMARDFIKDSIEKPIEKSMNTPAEDHGFSVKKPAQRIISRDEIPDEGPDESSVDDPYGIGDNPYTEEGKLKEDKDNEAKKPKEDKNTE